MILLKWQKMSASTNKLSRFLQNTPIIAQGVLDELKFHKTPQGKSNIKIILCRRKNYQITDLEYIRSRFDQVRPIVSHIEVRFPKKPPTPNNIGEG